MKKKLIICFSFFIFWQSNAMSEDFKIDTGYDFYKALKNGEKENSTNSEKANGYFALGFLLGYLNGYAYSNSNIQLDLLENLHLPYTSKVIKRIDSLYFDCQNIKIGQLIMIYYKWAEDNPEKLNSSSSECIFEVLKKTCKKGIHIK